MRLAIAAGLLFLSVLAARADCKFTQEAALLQTDGQPTKFKINCDDGRWGSGDIDSLGHVHAEIFPSPTDRKHFQSDFYYGEERNGHISLTREGPPRRP